MHTPSEMLILSQALWIRPKLHKSHYFGWTQPWKNVMIKSPLQCCVDFSLKLNVNEITKSFKTFDWKLNFRLCKNLKIRAKSKFYHTLHSFKFFHGPKLIMWMSISWMIILFKFQSFKILNAFSQLLPPRSSCRVLC